jgi:uncharacterized protein YkwD
MKKFLSFIFILFVLIGITYFLKINNFQFNLPQINVSNLNQVINDVKKEAFTPEPIIQNVKPKNLLEDQKLILTNNGILYWTNFYRNQNGFENLIENDVLDKVATLRAKDMFEKQYFSHYSNQGIGAPQIAESVGYEYIAIGENIALGNFKDDKDLVIAWMNSPGHRANILNSKYSEIGIAVMQGQFKDDKMDKAETVWIAVQVFGKPLGSCQKPDENLKLNIEKLKNEINDLVIEATQMYNDLQNNKVFYSQDDIINYNQKVSVYNDLVKEIKSKEVQLNNLILKYNLEVEIFNKCIQI